MLSHSFFLLKSQDDLQEKSEEWLNFFYLFINNRMKLLVIATQIVPKFDRVQEILNKEFSEFSWNYYWLKLVWMNWWIESIMSSIYKVCNNNNMIDTRDLNSLIDPISNSEKLSFCGSDVDYIIDSFLDKVHRWVNICYEYNNLVFNTCIWDYNSYL